MTWVLLWIQRLVTILRVQSPSLLALVTGNCLIVKPSPYAPLGTLKFGELAQQILPPGVLSVLSGNDEL
jgi:acyl-CoA reductase-like NAD-dependent aldehyde dehydrogenase